MDERFERKETSDRLVHGMHSEQDLGFCFFSKAFWHDEKQATNKMPC